MKTQAITAIAISVITYITPALAQTSNTTPGSWPGPPIDPNSPLIKDSELAQPTPNYPYRSQFWSDDPVSKAFEGATNKAFAFGQAALRALHPPATIVNVPPELNPNTAQGQAFLNKCLKQPASLSLVRQQVHPFSAPTGANTDLYTWSGNNNK
jgi:hypothetical protein